jgi:hypothetical protein
LTRYPPLHPRELAYILNGVGLTEAEFTPKLELWLKRQVKRGLGINAIVAKLGELLTNSRL